MLKVLKRIKQEVKESFEPYRDPMEVIAEIHAEFDSATDKLFKEAQEILSRNDIDNEGLTLRQLGFNKTHKAMQTELAIGEKAKGKNLADNIAYFKERYPNYKYVTDSVVKRICEKYGLVFGDVQHYIGEVPAKNVKEMASFSLMEDDGIHITHRYYEYIEKQHCLYATDKKTELFGYMADDDLGFWGYAYVKTDTSIPFHYKTPSLKICASVKDFDMKNMKIDDGYKLNLNLPDPVVLQPVARGGYLVISKWGLEANDQELVVETNN
jgi:hypothetical protein